MLKKTVRILFVISNQLVTNEEIYAKVRDYHELMDRFDKLYSIKPEYFLLYVGMRVSNLVSQTPEMIQYAINENERGERILHNAGRILNIPVERQRIVAGNADIQALRTARLLKADRVLGYSRGL